MKIPASPVACNPPYFDLVLLFFYNQDTDSRAEVAKYASQTSDICLSFKLFCMLKVKVK